MVRALSLGIAKITFAHQYDTDLIHNKKTHVTNMVRKPISTTVSIETSAERASAKSICSPKDHFSFEKGRKEGLKKCFAKMSISKTDRRRIWDEYNKLKTGGRW